jgi:hypothetical protein
MIASLIQPRRRTPRPLRLLAHLRRQLLAPLDFPCPPRLSRPERAAEVEVLDVREQVLLVERRRREVCGNEVLQLLDQLRSRDVFQPVFRQVAGLERTVRGRVPAELV